MEYTIKNKDEVKDILMGTSLIPETVVTPSQPTLVSADKTSFSPNDVRDILFGGSARQETTYFLPTPDSELLPKAYDSFSQTSSLLEEDEETPWFRRAGEAIEYSISSTIGSGKTPAQQEELNKLLALLREPDQRTGEVSLFGHGLAKIAETGPVGTRFVTGLIDAVNIGGGVAPDLVEKAVAETGGVDGVLGTALNSILSGFGRYRKAKNSRELAGDFAVAAGGFLEFAEVIPATGLVSRLRKLDIVSDEDLRQAIRNTPEIAAFATREAREEAQARAASVASQNVDIAEQLIEAFETTTRKTISVLDQETGRRVIDPTQARQAAQETLEEMGKDVTGFEQDLVMPILNPDKFNGIVALASDYRKAFPEQFDPNKNIIENLLDITVERKIVPSGQLIDDLNNYGLSFEEYVLGVFGSGSTAGRVLQKLSQIADVRKAVGKEADDELSTQLKLLGNIRKGWVRLEGTRRGGLVSMLATASRNFLGVTVRLPLESLGNVVDTALQGGAGKLFDGKTWSDAFDGYKYIFSRPDVAKGYTDLILNDSVLINQATRMFDNLNEIRKSADIKGADKFNRFMAKAEKVVDFLNIPNRWQEHLVRRGVFFSELQRLVRNEYKIDLIDALQRGKLADLINDVSGVRPDKTRSFIALVDEAVTKSLDVTYAKTPDLPIFNELANFITRNGLTVVIDFPRFMFNSIELMAQYGGGASIPLTKKLMGIIDKSYRGPMTSYDRQALSRNIVGVAAAFAFAGYRNSEFAPADYKQVNTPEGVLDTTALYPLRQYLFAGEAIRRRFDGTFGDWFDAREFIETFSGLNNSRSGQTNILLEQLSEIADGTDVTSSANWGKAIGNAVGDYISTWATPFAQLVEAQRAMGQRGLEYRDVRGDPELGLLDNILKGIARPLAQRGITLSPEEEAELPLRQYLFQDERRRVNPIGRVLLGLSQTTGNEEYAEYLISKGFTEYSVSSTSDVPSVQRWENEHIRRALPIIVEAVRSLEPALRKQYQEKSEEFKDAFSENKFVNSEIVPYLRKYIDDVRSSIRSIDVGARDQYTSSLMEFSRLPKEARSSSVIRYFDMYGKYPDTSKLEDLSALAAIGRAMLNR